MISLCSALRSSLLQPLNSFAPGLAVCDKTAAGASLVCGWVVNNGALDVFLGESFSSLGASVAEAVILATKALAPLKLTVEDEADGEVLGAG